MGFTLKGGAAVDGSCFEKPSEMAAAGDCPGEPGEEAVRKKQAFAVYSDADKSLRFYNRAEVPEEGEDFEGRTVGAVYKAEAFDGHRWYAHAEDVETVSVVDEGIAPRSTAYWFYMFDHMTSCDLAKLDTANVVDMDWMFSGCDGVKVLDLSGMDTSGVEIMDDMFQGCSSLERIELARFDTSGARRMFAMFKDCSSLEAIDVSSFETGRVVVMSCMFEGCSSLKELDLSGFDMSRVVDMRCMFQGCIALEKLDLTGFRFRKGVKLAGFAADCGAAGPELLESIVRRRREGEGGDAHRR